MITSQFLAGIILVIAIGLFITIFVTIFVLTYRHNHKYKLWTTRIVKTNLGIFQVQCWQNDSVDWEGMCPLNWYPIDNFGFNGKSDYKTLEEAYEAKKEFEKRAYEWENKDKVAEVIEGPKN